MARTSPQDRLRAATRSPGGRRVIALVAVIATLAVAVGGALVTADAASGLNLAVERASSWFSNALGDIGTLLPFGLAFAAGMVSAFNPCGFPLLPAFLGLFLSDNDAGTRPAARLVRALTVGGTVTAGFVLLFAAVGLTIGLGARALIEWLPGIALGLGVMLVGVGGYLLAGGTLYTSLPEQLGARVGTGGRGTAAYFLFGLTYGLASLSCTLPIFLAVVGTSLTGASVTSSLGALILYGLGMGTVITTLTVATGMFKSALALRMRGVLRYIGTIGTTALFAAGAYIVYYWLTIGGLLGGLPGAG